MRLTFTAALLLAAVTVASGQPQSTLNDPAAAFFDDTQVREIRLDFDDPNWFTVLQRSHQSDPADPYFPCKFTSSGVTIDKIGCRFKGNSSFQRNGIKKPFKLDFNEFDDSATFFGLKKLNINNFDLQPDFMREKLLHDLAGRYVAALRSVYVRLYVNGAFYGLYLAVEQPDKTMMQSRFGSSEDGNLYEGEEQMGGSRPTLAWLGSSQSAYESIYILKTNETQNDFSRLIQFLDVLNNTPTEELYGKLDTIADMENWMAAMAVNNLVVNLDSYLGAGAEYYLYDRTLDGKFIHIQWDHNESFGITGDGTPRLATPATTDPFWLPSAATGGGPGGGGGNAASNARPFLTKTWAVPEYRRLYLRALARFLRNGFNPEYMTARTAQLSALIREHVAADPNKTYSLAQFDSAINSLTANIPGINQFVRDRYAYLRNYLDGQAEPADVRINEVAPGEAEPWVEIYNPGPGPVNLSGFYLTDTLDQPTKWALPSGTVLADGAFLRIRLDGGSGAGHASFAMPAAGGHLYLFASAVSGSTPLDSITVAALPAGQSQIRMGLFGTRWETTATPTPAAENVLTVPGVVVSAKLVINEIMADNDSVYEDPDEPGAFEDWFEIYNPGTEAVDMSGMYITDNPQNPTKWKVGDGVVIPAGGYLVFLADNEASQGPRHAAFALSADGESLSLHDKDGTTLIDTISFGAQTKDVSFGRTPDGGSTWTSLTPTPGAANPAP